MAPTSSLPTSLRDIPETSEEEDDASAPPAEAIMALQGKPKSRLQRVSAYLSPLQTSSKVLEDLVKKTAPTGRSSPNPTPSQDAPAVYESSSHDVEKPLPPPPSISTPNLLRKDSPNRISSQPRKQSPPTITTMQVQPRSRKNSLIPPPALTELGHQRNGSVPLISRPNSLHSGSDSDAGLASKLRKRSSWLPGGNRPTSRNVSSEIDLGPSRAAWIRAGAETIEYGLLPLLNSEKITELWTEEADTIVYLFPRSSECGPSFRVPSMILSSSRVLTSLIQGEINNSGGGQERHKSFDGRATLDVIDASRNLPDRGLASPPYSPDNANFDMFSSTGIVHSMDSLGIMEPPKEIHLYFPSGVMSSPGDLTPDDTQTLVDIRNLFAFLTGQPLVATSTNPEIFHIFLAIARLLKQLDFSNIDGSTYGEAATNSFEFYVEELSIADVRGSLEKTLEALVLGESMRSSILYNEAFSHVVGRYEVLRDFRSALFHQVTSTTMKRLSRAYMELTSRQRSVDLRLTDLEFPSMFAGIGSSTSSAESKVVRFKQWKLHFSSMRRFTIGYLKDLYGHWPPRANSKKNTLVKDGLNRVVLRTLYNDLCQLYTFLVDRSSHTTRSMDQPDDDVSNQGQPLAHLILATLRKLLSEFDRSSPPVQPPIPFDAPLVPSMTTIDPTFVNVGPKEQNKQLTRRLQDHEIMLLLTRAHNLDSDIKTPFIQAFKIFELEQAQGKSAQDLAEQRFGFWIFLYAVLQSLPMLVVDAPDVRFTEGVEYFLCQPPMGNLPWIEDKPAFATAWYGVGNGAVVNLPSDIVKNGTEAIYHRSYCWVVAQNWFETDPEADEIPQTDMEVPFSPLEPPPGLAGGQFGLRPESRGRQRGSINGDGAGSSSRNSSNKRNSSITMGLEELPIPRDYNPFTTGSPPIPSQSNSPIEYPRDLSTSRIANHSRRGSAVPGGLEPTGPTFDQILGSMAEPAKATKSTKSAKPAKPAKPAKSAKKGLW